MWVRENERMKWGKVVEIYEEKVGKKWEKYMFLNVEINVNMFILFLTIYSFF